MGCVEWEREENTVQLVHFGFVIPVETNLSKRVKTWLFLMRVGARTGCHQMYERSFHVAGYQFPVCARCTGLALGDILGIVFSGIFLKWDIRVSLFLCGAALMGLAVDGFGQLWGFWVSNNVRRLLTGILCGCFTMGAFIKFMYTVFG